MWSSVTSIFQKLKTHVIKTWKGKSLKLKLGVGRREGVGKHTCEGFKLVFQVKLLLSQYSKVYFEVRANCIFFDCLADLENLISYCFGSRTWKSNSKQWATLCSWQVNTKNTKLINSSSLAHLLFIHHSSSKVSGFSKRKYHVDDHHAWFLIFR